MVRRLTLKTEHLAELGTDDLSQVNGAVSGTTCVTNLAACQISRQVLSLCGCLTNYCSIDVC